MELRSYNVEKVWSDCVKCRINEDLGIDKQSFQTNLDNIKDMISQVKRNDGYNLLKFCNWRVDGECWTPYLQIVEMLIRLAKKAGYVDYKGNLGPRTLIKFL